jgi:hypothetical protein
MSAALGPSGALIAPTLVAVLLIWLAVRLARAILRLVVVVLVVMLLVWGYTQYRQAAAWQAAAQHVATQVRRDLGRPLSSGPAVLAAVHKARCGSDSIPARSRRPSPVWTGKRCSCSRIRKRRGPGPARRHDPARPSVAGDPLREWAVRACLMERTLITPCVGNGQRPWGQRGDRPREIDHDACLQAAQRRP